MASYGTEILFPFQIDASGRVSSTNDPNQIVRQRIEQIVFTMFNERVMRPDFGSGAMEFLFEGEGTGFEMLMVDRIKTDVQNLTTGITVNSVELDTSHWADDAVVGVNISYSYEVLGDRFTSQFITNVGNVQHTQEVR